ncbi:MAG: carboxylating nicotinate-nucleotide diphosphorylase [Isosphaeraceae bacterium]|nr:carboxylating nicotinate-nucleotide diphosphorylase [Isosphaeraceae bacterium]
MPPDFDDKARAQALALIEVALAEDLGDRGDLTSLAVIPADAQGSAVFVSRVDGVVAGLPVVELLAERVISPGAFAAFIDDGCRVARGQPIARVDGTLRSILGFERVALNFLQHLGGIATLTARFVDAVEGTRARILDTRKTTPGLRHLQKYAVRCGGGTNHRIGLFDAILIKDNHLAGLAEHEGESSAIATAVARGRSIAPPGTIVEIEVDTLDQFEQALAADPDIILVDNFGPAELREAVERRNRSGKAIALEASGGVDLTTVRALAETGVDRISIGAITHSAKALDIGLDYVSGIRESIAR